MANHLSEKAAPPSWSYPVFSRAAGTGWRLDAPGAMGKCLTGLPGVHIECKRAEALRLSEWMEQSERDAARFGDGLPAVFHRRNRQGWLCTMHLEDWLELYRSYYPAERRQSVDVEKCEQKKEP